MSVTYLDQDYRKAIKRLSNYLLAHKVLVFICHINFMKLIIGTIYFQITLPVDFLNSLADVSFDKIGDLIYSTITLDPLAR